MRTKIIIGFVCCAHVIVVGSLVLMQGCSLWTGGGVATAPPGGEPPPPLMPPRSFPKTPPMVPPVVRTPGPSFKGTTTTYTVRKGDSISVIARRFGVSARQIIDINQIKNPDKIVHGQKILLPGNVDVTKSRRVTRSSPRVVAGAGEYVVKKGDTLSEIALRHGTTTRRVREANRLSSDLILVGQVIKLPDGAKPQPAAAPAVAVDVPDEFAGLVATEPDDPPAPAVVVTPPLVPAALTSPAGVVDDGEFITHTVKKDEDIYDVGLEYGVMPEELRQLNGLEGNALQEGQKLKIRVREARE